MSRRLGYREQFEFGGQKSAASGATDPIFPDGTRHSLQAVISAAANVNWQITNDDWRDVLDNPAGANWTTLASGTLTATGSLDYDSGGKIFRVAWDSNTGTIDLKQTSSG